MTLSSRASGAKPVLFAFTTAPMNCIGPFWQDAFCRHPSHLKEISMTSFSAFRLECPATGEPPKSHIRQLQLNDLSPGDTIIKVAFAGVNYKDALAANGQGKIVRDYPRVSGIDL